MAVVSWKIQIPTCTTSRQESWQTQQHHADRILQRVLQVARVPNSPNARGEKKSEAGHSWPIDDTAELQGFSAGKFGSKGCRCSGLVSLPPLDQFRETFPSFGHTQSVFVLEARWVVVVGHHMLTVIADNGGRSNA